VKKYRTPSEADEQTIIHIQDEFFTNTYTHGNNTNLNANNNSHFITFTNTNSSAICHTNRNRTNYYTNINNTTTNISIIESDLRSKENSRVKFKVNHESKKKVFKSLSILNEKEINDKLRNKRVSQSSRDKYLFNNTKLISGSDNKKTNRSVKEREIPKKEGRNSKTTISNEINIIQFDSKIKNRKTNLSLTNIENTISSNKIFKKAENLIKNNKKRLNTPHDNKGNLMLFNNTIDSKRGSSSKRLSINTDINIINSNVLVNIINQTGSQTSSNLNIHVNNTKTNINTQNDVNGSNTVSNNKFHSIFRQFFSPGRCNLDLQTNEDNKYKLSKMNTLALTPRESTDSFQNSIYTKKNGLKKSQIIVEDIPGNGISPKKNYKNMKEIKENEPKYYAIMKNNTINKFNSKSNKKRIKELEQSEIK
jgi:hypothetical protein